MQWWFKMAQTRNHIFVSLAQGTGSPTTQCRRASFLHAITIHYLWTCSSNQACSGSNAVIHINSSTAAAQTLPRFPHNHYGQCYVVTWFNRKARDVVQNLNSCRSFMYLLLFGYWRIRDILIIWVILIFFFLCVCWVSHKELLSERHNLKTGRMLQYVVELSVVLLLAFDKLAQSHVSCSADFWAYSKLKVAPWPSGSETWCQKWPEALFLDET